MVTQAHYFDHQIPELYVKYLWKFRKIRPVRIWFEVDILRT